jgi:hypothetical protein
MGNEVTMLLKTKGVKKMCKKMKISLDRNLESGILADVNKYAPVRPGRFAF